METIVVAAAEDTAAVEEDIAVMDMTMEGADTVADILAAAAAVEKDIRPFRRDMEIVVAAEDTMITVDGAVEEAVTMMAASEWPPCAGT